MVESKGTILIVDDDKLTLAMLSDIFARGFDVLTAVTGEEAVAKLEENEVTAVLCDHIMPGLTGVDVLERCMVLRPNAVRVLVTASEDVKDIRDAINVARVHRVVVKPVHSVEVEGIVHGAVRERDLEMENARLVDELKKALADLKTREHELEHELQIRTQELRDVMKQALKSKA